MYYYALINLCLISENYFSTTNKIVVYDTKLLHSVCSVCFDLTDLRKSELFFAGI